MPHDPFPLVDDVGLVLQNEDGIYLDDVEAYGIATATGRVGATGDVTYDGDGIPIRDVEGFVLQNSDGIYLDDVVALGTMFAKGRIGATGDILYDEGDDLMMAPLRFRSLAVPTVDALGSSEEQPMNLMRMSVTLDDVDTLASSVEPMDEVIHLTARISRGARADSRVVVRLGDNFTIREGDPVVLAVHLLNPDGSDFDLTGCRLSWWLNVAGRALVTLKTSENPDQMMIPNREGGAVRVYLTARDTAVPPGSYGSGMFRHEMTIDTGTGSQTAMAGVVHLLRRVAA